MASQIEASQIAPPPIFGVWLRNQRAAKGAMQRNLAAVADMDSSHLGKVERGERLPTAEQATAIARFLDVDEMEMRARLAAARLLLECDGDPSLANAAAGFVQEHAAPYLPSRHSSKRRTGK